MDELALALKLDPIELRLRCYSDRDQHENRPYASKALRECYRQGAAAFGWEKRNPAPRSMRDGTDLVGWGMATGIWEALQAPIAVRIALTANGHAEVACATSDIGTGTYTIMAQVAADMLGLPLENISIKLGDSSLPQSPVEGGSWIATSVSNGIVTTAGAIREELLRFAKQVPDSPLANAGPDEVMLADGRLVSKRDPKQSVSIADAMRHGAVERIEQEKTTNPSEDYSRANNTHVAHFVEVKIRTACRGLPARSSRRSSSRRASLPSAGYLIVARFASSIFAGDVLRQRLAARTRCTAAASRPGRGGRASPARCSLNDAFITSRALALTSASVGMRRAADEHRAATRGDEQASFDMRIACLRPSALDRGRVERGAVGVAREEHRQRDRGVASRTRAPGKRCWRKQS